MFFSSNQVTDIVLFKGFLGSTIILTLESIFSFQKCLNNCKNVNSYDFKNISLIYVIIQIVDFF